MPANRHLARLMQPAAWRRLAVGLLATLALSLQGGAALAHTHAPSVTAMPATLDLVAGPLAGDVQKPGNPAQDDLAAQCPLCHSPLGHGGILVPSETVLADAVRYASDTALPPAIGPPGLAPSASPPARAPPASI